jgi:hypothetical protein
MICLVLSTRYADVILFLHLEVVGKKTARYSFSICHNVFALSHHIQIGLIAILHFIYINFFFFFTFHFVGYMVQVMGVHFPYSFFVSLSALLAVFLCYTMARYCSLFHSPSLSLFYYIFLVTRSTTRRASHYKPPNIRIHIPIIIHALSLYFSINL